MIYILVLLLGILLERRLDVSITMERFIVQKIANYKKKKKEVKKKALEEWINKRQ